MKEIKNSIGNKTIIYAQTSDGKIISYRADAFEETFELVND